MSAEMGALEEIHGIVEGSGPLYRFELNAQQTAIPRRRVFCRWFSQKFPEMARTRRIRRMPHARDRAGRIQGKGMEIRG